MFIETTKAKAEAHGKVAQYWNSVNTYLGLILILLSAVTTVLAAIEVEGVSKMVTVGLSGLTTLISAVAGENLNVRFERQIYVPSKVINDYIVLTLFDMGACPPPSDKIGRNKKLVHNLVMHVS